MIKIIGSNIFSCINKKMRTNVDSNPGSSYPEALALPTKLSGLIERDINKLIYENECDE